MGSESGSTGCECRYRLAAYLDFKGSDFEDEGYITYLVSRGIVNIPPVSILLF